MRLIDADALIKAFNEAQVEFDEYYKGLGKAKVITDNASTVTPKLPTEVKKALEVLKAMKQGRWIPVSEKLPENRNLVLVTAYWHDTYQVMQASYFGEGEKNGWWCVPWNNCGEHMRNDLHVIAWQELPDPYKPGGAV